MAASLGQGDISPLMGQEFGGRAALKVLSNLNMCHTSSNQSKRRWLKQFFVCFILYLIVHSQRLHWSKRKRNTFLNLTSVAFFNDLSE